MENQQRKITGYRELSQTEIDLMNKIKALGPVIEGVIQEVRTHLDMQKVASYAKGNPEEVSAITQRLVDATPGRFTELAKTDFQTALMYLTRAVAQPTFF